MKTQAERISAALDSAGPLGITAVDFLLPDVIDGGAPITRLSARIKDLKDAGQAIEVAGTRSKCAVYRRPVSVVSGAQPSPAKAAGVDALELALDTTKPAPTCAIYEEDWAA